MSEQSATALAQDRVIDITTIGRRSGSPSRIEIWFHRVDGRYYITGTPGRPRDWYANLVANPAFTFHLKQSATADLPATARPVTDPGEREQVFTALLTPLHEITSRPGHAPEFWIAGSPLVEVTFPPYG
ncbi:nitroreductase family deazaflavin-dependent oxidoreductase [Winogradskya humida]|uniref:Deazaflavin-dependent oxidoreductase (Nitroreductase family) n=1 Tax=Winogradskya humida TaxID=113566 RepID=A0ABQ3ZJI7_9ACTN|nr:nitroreductase family deazaflavin-dependent oxidoreductase [Actinoplanes humidus]GIE18754.1 hypothetical protein Ahu01nite_018560 [Actinoplanes humidus]